MDYLNKSTKTTTNIEMKIIPQKAAIFVYNFPKIESATISP